MMLRVKCVDDTFPRAILYSSTCETPRAVRCGTSMFRLNGTSLTAAHTFKQMISEIQCLESFILKAQAVDNDDMAPAETAWQCFGKGDRSRPIVSTASYDKRVAS